MKIKHKKKHHFERGTVKIMLQAYVCHTMAGKCIEKAKEYHKKAGELFDKAILREFSSVRKKDRRKK